MTIDTDYSASSSSYWAVVWAYLLLLFFGIAPLFLSAQANTTFVNIWETPKQYKTPASHERTAPLPLHYHVFTTDFSALKNYLSAAPARFSAATPLTVGLPLASGDLQVFHVTKTSLLPVNLNEKFPAFATYSLTGAHQNGWVGNLVITHRGVYAMLIYQDKEVHFIEPLSTLDSTHYLVYNTNDLTTAEHWGQWSCETSSAHSTHQHNSNPSLLSSMPCQLKKYKIAIATTGEYSQWQGGTTTDALAEVVLLVSRANVILEKQIGVSLELIGNNDAIIFLDSLTDPFNNANKFAMLAEVENLLEADIGANTYDLGHVLAITGGGVAAGRACNDKKERGVSGSTWYPNGYPLLLTFVHELGHMFSAEHSFNNHCNGNRIDASAFETGSGVSLMSYAGACAPNVHYPRLPYFHAHSLAQIRTYIEQEAYACAELVNTGLTLPQVNAGTDVYLPTSTPFQLEGDVTNTPNGTLGFTWEQMNNETTAAPPVPENEQGPAFRSWNEKTVPIRNFPEIGCLLPAANSQNCEWESLPAVARPMDFSFVANAVQDGVGCWAADEIHLTFVEDVFTVTQPNIPVTYSPGQTIDVHWITGNTANAPIHCTEISIYLSTDGGQSFTYLLSETTDNDGTETVTLPAITAEQCLIKVACPDVGFYDLSDDFFSIENALHFDINTSDTLLSYCNELPSSTTFTLTIDAVSNTPAPLTISAENLPAGIVAAFSTPTFTPPATVQCTFSGWNMYDNYDLPVILQSATFSTTQTLHLHLTADVPVVPSLYSPTSGVTGMPKTVTLAWQQLPNVLQYEVEIAVNPDFSEANLVSSIQTSDAYFTCHYLTDKTVYYWRVRAHNACGNSDWSSIFSFQTQEKTCNSYSGSNYPLTISDDALSSIYSVIQVPDSQTIETVEISDFSVSHEQVGDLSARLIHPDGTPVELFYRLGYNANSDPEGCSSGNIDAAFSDTAVPFQNAPGSPDCANLPAITGEWQPLEKLETFSGKNAEGPWLLALNDHHAQHGGTLNLVTLHFCSYANATTTAPVLATNNPLFLSAYSTATVSNEHLWVTPTTTGVPTVYRLVQTPKHGHLTLSNTIKSVGETFTQSNILSNLLTYHHTDNEVHVLDSFLVDVRIGDDYLGVQTVYLHIDFPILQAAASVVQQPACHGAATGVIEINTQTGLPPFQYSLDGEIYQTAATFTNLPAGTYTAWVTDAMGQSFEISDIEIVAPAALEIETSVNDYEITIMAAGGTGDFQYSFNNGSFQSDNTFFAPENGTYIVVVMDENGCLTTEGVAIDVTNNTLAANLQVAQQPTCANEASGVLVVAVNGGYEPFTYALSSGISQSSPEFINLAAATYTVLVTDAEGFTYQTNEVTLTNPDPVTATTTVSGYEISIVPLTGVPPFMYSIDDAAPVTTPTFTGEPGEVYQIEVQDAHNCHTTIFASVNVEVPVVSATTIQSASCYGAADGSITIVAEGGVTPLQYSIDGEKFQPSPMFIDWPAQSYQVSILDAGGYIFEAGNVEVTQPNELQTAVQSSGTMLEMTATGGTPPYEYSLNGWLYQASGTFLEVANGTYTCYVRDANNCTFSTVITHVGTPLSATLSGIDTIDCWLDEPALVTLCVEGGLPPFVISATPTVEELSVSPTNDCNSHFNLLLDPALSLTFDVQVQDATGSQTVITHTFHPVEMPNLLATVTEDDVTLEGEGGAPPYLYSFGAGSFQQGNVFSNLPNGTYEFSVQDSNGCLGNVTAIINVDTTVVTTYTGNTAFSVHVFPNPVQRVAYLQLQSGQQTPVQITLQSITGEQLWKQSFVYRETISLALPWLPDGVYVMNIKQGAYSVPKKIVVH